MSLEPPKAEIKSATRVTGGPVSPRKGPPKFKQRQTRQFKSKPPKKGIQGFGDDIPGMEGLGTGTKECYFFLLAYEFIARTEDLWYKQAALSYP
ncbi:Retinal rod rhodopsin-sensitive cGMP 3',5'-cyclic phosphodiesterase subunit gamma [Varanus komodoensis]|nr:Retinal rod rhodopsin-sensitive cGMP 3',5'-cyclic phosphodiesterase subunit gamma [Varanus komodoensis]